MDIVCELNTCSSITLSITPTEFVCSGRLESRSVFIFLVMYTSVALETENGSCRGCRPPFQVCAPHAQPHFMNIIRIAAITFTPTVDDSALLVRCSATLTGPLPRRAGCSPNRRQGKEGAKGVTASRVVAVKWKEPTVRRRDLPIVLPVSSRSQVHRSESSQTRP